MAFRSGFVTGFGDDTGAYVFTPTTDGYSIPINREQQGGEGPEHGLWRQYGTPIPVQANIIYTAAASALVQVPLVETMAAADAGSGKGDKMVFPTPTNPGYPVTDAEAQVIVDDGTYKDEVAQ